MSEEPAPYTPPSAPEHQHTYRIEANRNIIIRYCTDCGRAYALQEYSDMVDTWKPHTYRWQLIEEAE